jgi:hypothetical protein
MRKILFHIFLLVLIAVFITSCFASQNTMQSWIGKTKAELYQRFGPPERITDDGQGGEILIYEKTDEGGGSNQQNSVSPNQSNSAAMSLYTPVNIQHDKVTYIKMFYCNKQGIIYHWRSETR